MKYLIYLVAGTLALEGSFRACDRLLFESQHLALFKPALARLQPKVDVMILGSSRIERGVLPSVLDESLARHGAPRHTFSVGIADTSRDIFAYVCSQVREREGLRAAIIEVGQPHTIERPLEWEAHDDLTTLEGRLAASVRAHVALVKLRAAVRFDSLTRLVAAALFAWAFDGSEHYGIDYVRAVFRARERAPLEDVTWEPQTPTIPPAVSDRFQKSYASYLECARPLIAKGVAVTFLAVPLSDRYVGPERDEDFAALLAELAKTAPVWSFDRAGAGAEHFLDSHHLNTRGATQFSDRLGALLARRWNAVQ